MGRRSGRARPAWRVERSRRRRRLRAATRLGRDEQALADHDVLADVVDGAQVARLEPELVGDGLDGVALLDRVPAGRSRAWRVGGGAWPWRRDRGRGSARADARWDAGRARRASARGVPARPWCRGGVSRRGRGGAASRAGDRDRSRAGAGVEAVTRGAPRWPRAMARATARRRPMPGDRPPPRMAASATMPTRMTPPPTSRLGMPSTADAERRRPWSPPGGRASTATGTGLTNGPNRADSSRPTSIWSLGERRRALVAGVQEPFAAAVGRRSGTAPAACAVGSGDGGSTAQQRCSRVGTAERHVPSAARRYGQMAPSHRSWPRADEATWHTRHDDCSRPGSAHGQRRQPCSDRAADAPAGLGRWSRIRWPSSPS